MASEVLMCHVHIYHNYIPPVICGTLVGKGPRIIKNLAWHPTLVLAVMEMTQSIRKYRYPAMCAMGHEAPQAGGSGWLVPSSCHTTTYKKKMMLTSLKKLRFPWLHFCGIYCAETSLYNVIHKSKHMAVIFIFIFIFRSILMIWKLWHNVHYDNFLFNNNKKTFKPFLSSFL
jgi:hypothetical protein